MNNDALAPGWSAPDRPAGPPAPAPGPPAAGFGSPPPPRRVVLPPGIAPPTPPPPGGYPWPGPATARHPSGLFPAGGPPRPTYREPNPARLGPAALGAGATALWMLLFGLLAGSARGYVWWTVTAGVLAWLAALALARWGLRGVAAGVAVSAGLALAIAGIVVTVHWLDGYWLLW